MRGNNVFLLLFHSGVVAFVLAPRLSILLVAFTPENTLSIPTNGISLRWFHAILDHPDFITAFYNSVQLAFFSATASLCIALPAGLAIVRSDFRGKQFLNALFLSPLVIPHLVLGVAILRLFTLLGLGSSFSWLVISHVVIVTPFALRLILSAAAGMDRSVEHAALSLGAAQWTVFRRITLPMILPGISGGWLLAFINSFDELTMSIFVTTPSTVTLPVRMYAYATESIDPMMASVSALIIMLTAVCMVILDRVYGLDKILVGQKGSS
jgi:putative spermidine/putrescine transport system permease protein